MQLKPILAALATASSIVTASAVHAEPADYKSYFFVPEDASAQVFARFQFRDDKGTIQTGQAMVNVPITSEDLRNKSFKQKEPIAVWTAVAKRLGKNVSLRPDGLATLEKEGLVLNDYKVVGTNPSWLNHLPDILF